jgi:hypothetical protein
VHSPFAGPPGPPGPVGPDAEDAIYEVASDVEDLDSRVSDLESTIEDICFELSYSSIEDLENVWFAAC